jgi:hypothetical protein
MLLNAAAILAKKKIIASSSSSSIVKKIHGGRRSLRGIISGRSGKIWHTYLLYARIWAFKLSILFFLFLLMLVCWPLNPLIPRQKMDGTLRY